MLVFADNPTQFMDEYSETFEKDFIEMMKHRYNEKRVKANDAYKEFIADRHHQHMNSTTWQTLTDFVIYLGRTGKCKVDQTPKGWFMSFINRDPEVIARREQIEKKEKLERADEDIAEKSIAQQIKMAKQAEGEAGLATHRSEATDMLRSEGDESKVVMTSLAAPKKAEPLKAKPMGMSFSSSGGGGGGEAKKPAEKRKMSAMEEMIFKNEQSKEKKARRDYWLCEGIIVKCMNKSICDGVYYKRKGVVRKVVETFTGVVKMLDDGVKIKIDQDQLETVIPNTGGAVRIVNGAYRDAEAVVKSIDVDNFCVKLEITQGPYRGQTVQVDYEDACKLDKD